MGAACQLRNCLPCTRCPLCTVAWLVRLCPSSSVLVKWASPSAHLMFLFREEQRALRPPPGSHLDTPAHELCPVKSRGFLQHTGASTKYFTSRLQVFSISCMQASPTSTDLKNDTDCLHATTLSLTHPFNPSATLKTHHLRYTATANSPFSFGGTKGSHTHHSATARRSHAHGVIRLRAS